MSQVTPVHVDIWRNPDQDNLMVAGAIPLGDYDVEPGPDRHSFESYQEGVEVYTQFYADETKLDEAPAKVARAKKVAK